MASLWKPGWQVRQFVEVEVQVLQGVAHLLHMPAVKKKPSPHWSQVLFSCDRVELTGQLEHLVVLTEHWLQLTLHV